MSLPEKYYYKFDELSERWGKDGDYLFHLAINGTLRITCSKPLSFSDFRDVDGEISPDPSEWDIFSTEDNIPLSTETIRDLVAGIEKVTPTWQLDNGRRGAVIRNLEHDSNLPEFTITLADIVVLVEEVERVEKLYPEIKNADVDQCQIEEATIVEETKNEENDLRTLMNPSGSRFLTGWKEIREYLGGVSESTAKRYAKAGKWLQHSETNRPITTTYEIDEWRKRTSKRKK